MKVNKIITSTEPIDITFTGARLLAKEEVEELPKRLRLHTNWWWTNSANALYSSIVLCVFGDSGCVSNEYTCNANVARPALLFKSKSLKIGDRFSVAGLEFEVITDDLAFCLSDIGECRFRNDVEAKDANQYETSDVKKFVDNWFKENVK